MIVERASGPSGAATATVDPTGAYRFRLRRTWDPDGPVVAFVMANPSTADAVRLDPTVRRCLGFARSWGFGGLDVVNCFALRATRPADLFAHPEPVGRGNDRVVAGACRAADLVVAAWGVAGAHRGRADAVLALLSRAGTPVHVLGTTNGGHPRHPLYVPATTRPVPWNSGDPAVGGVAAPGAGAGAGRGARFDNTW